MPADHPALLVFTNLPDADSAARLAGALVERRLAACVNVLGPCQSTYRWQGQLESATEIPLLIKTTRERYSELEATVKELHPYQLPELIAVELAAGHPAYLGWIAECCQPAA